MSLPVIVVGAGGHAVVSIDALRSIGVAIVGVVDTDVRTHGQTILGVPVIGSDDAVFRHQADSLRLVNGVGSIGLPRQRTEIFERFFLKGYEFAVVVHSAAVVAVSAVLGQGTQIMAGAVVQPGCRIGRNAIVNTSATVDHDCIIGDHVHLAPGATLSGGVRVGDGTHIGAGATVIQGISVGSNVVVGAGSVVLRDVEAGKLVVGVPARVVSR